MVTQDGETLTLRPEEQHAQRVLLKLALRPPVDVEAVVSGIADIEEDHLPASADAVTIDSPTGRGRPLVIINPWIAPNRKRFTLAHELGHLIIPWHIGIVVCHTDNYDAYGDSLYRTMESEANRFASEFLMPSWWLQDIVRKSQPIQHIFEEILEARVSKTAASIALCKVLPPGHLIAELAGDGRVIHSLRSPGTAASLPQEGTRLQRNAFEDACSDHAVIDNGENQIHWWAFDPSPVPSRENLPSARETLDEFLTSLGLCTDALSTLRQSINGVIGAANSHPVWDDEQQLHSVLLQRYSSNARTRPYLSHPGFKQYIALRAMEVAALRKPS